MTMICKFCGKSFSAPQFLSKNAEGSCGECVSFCMRKCLTANKTTTSWHKGECIDCEYNPYKRRYTWNGKRWERCAGREDPDGWIDNLSDHISHLEG